MRRRRSLACSFCKKHEHQVQKLVAGPRMFFCGPRVYICDLCAALSIRIMGQP